MLHIRTVCTVHMYVRTCTCVCVHLYVPCLPHTVPSAAPAVNIYLTTATNVTVAWESLPPCQENGVITSYTIAYRMEGGVDMTFTELVVPAANSTATVSQLTPYTNYTFKMAASTSAGRGVFGREVAVLTSEAGMSQSRATQT